MGLFELHQFRHISVPVLRQLSGHNALEFDGLVRELGLVLPEPFLPIILELPASDLAFVTAPGQSSRVHIKSLLGGITQVLLGRFDLVLSQGSSMAALAPGLVGAPERDLGPENDEGGFARFSPSRLKGLVHGRPIIPVAHPAAAASAG